MCPFPAADGPWKPPFLAPLINHGEVGDLQGIFSANLCDAGALGKQKLPLVSLKLGNSAACGPELPQISPLTKPSAKLPVLPAEVKPCFQHWCPQPASFGAGAPGAQGWGEEQGCALEGFTAHAGSSAGHRALAVGVPLPWGNLPTAASTAEWVVVLKIAEASIQGSTTSPSPFSHCTSCGQFLLPSGKTQHKGIQPWGIPQAAFWELGAVMAWKAGLHNVPSAVTPFKPALLLRAPPVCGGSRGQRSRTR